MNTKYPCRPPKNLKNNNKKIPTTTKTLKNLNNHYIIWHRDTNPSLTAWKVPRIAGDRHPGQINKIHFKTLQVYQYRNKNHTISQMNKHKHFQPVDTERIWICQQQRIRKWFINKIKTFPLILQEKKLNTMPVTSTFLKWKQSCHLATEQENLTACPGDRGG